MSPFKRLLRAHWSALALAVCSGVLLVAGAAWLLNSIPSKPLRWTALGLFILSVVGVVLKHRVTLLMLFVVVPKLRASVPRPARDAELKGLDGPVVVTLDEFGVPTIEARSRLDALRALGYVSARDRLFQMDLLRRGAAGRLTEVFGKGALETDTAQRVVGCNRVAAEIFSRLPAEQKESLLAYAEGVNAYISQMKTRPFEFLLLKYQPETWRGEDCVLALLQMFKGLSAEEEGKRRTLAVMESTLPEEVVAFLTPDASHYPALLGWGDEARRPVRPLPRAHLASLLERTTREGAAAPDRKIVRTEGMAAGSNCWAVDGSKTADGVAILANDMHTDLNVPNLWYRARLLFDGVDISGVTVPGIPMILAGSNTRVAWGLTNMLGGSVELVQLEVDPGRPDHYLTPDGWRPFEVIKESIKRKRGDFVEVEVKNTVWGPVLEKKLMGKPVALRWTALDGGVDFGLMRMERARTVEEAVAAANSFAGPPLNVIAADARGRIAYTVCGRLPVRKGSGAATTAGWADGGAGWTRYIEPDELPRIVESDEGFLASANNVSVGRDYPHVLGEGFPHSYRAYRIAERLRGMSGVGEAEMFRLQSDTACHVYEFYARLALEVLTDGAVEADPEMATVRRAILAWDKRAELESEGLVFITYFRESLALSVFTPLLRACAEADERFVYAWPNLDTPLRIILTERPAEWFAVRGRYEDWEQFITANLKRGVAELKEKLKVRSLEGLRWGEVNRAEVFHLLTPKDRSLFGSIFNMPPDPLPGCLFSVCSSEPGFGASVRMVVSPGREEAGVLHIACGQSGHPLSDNYDDQHGSWVRQEPLPFLPGRAASKFTLTPGGA
ncbi:MAG TPA: penicillin acylase family protein [Pyrinomonadaceae bacterium]|nr:penicillin acylase family protein [Pyrinomonadaceae bacterium]